MRDLSAAGEVELLESRTRGAGKGISAHMETSEASHAPVALVTKT